jgi:hypothetical protein
MSTTNTTTGNNSSSLTFNPNSQTLYNMLTQGGGGVLSGYMNNPFGNPAYTMGAAQSQAGAQQAGANNMAALNQNALTNGLTGQAGAGFMAAQKAQTGRANQAMSSQANVQNIMAALSRQMSAAGTGLSFSPQLTGQTGNFSQASTMSGLGTWLPQLLGSAGGAALGAATMGGPKAASAAAGMAAGGGGGATNPFMPSGQYYPTPPMAGMGSSGLAGMTMSGGNSNLPFGLMQQPFGN